ncbi:MAG: glutamate 5-kinase [Dehalococcoidia bacterium]|nr:glutamate 5-kinase [Dehalococcoidia bacterium]
MSRTKDRPVSTGHIEARYHRLVVKMGTNLLTGGGDRLNLEVMANLVGQLAHLHSTGREAVMVSSGAIAAGRHRLALGKDHGRGMPLRQVFASVGQSRLMNAWDQLFNWHDITVAQTLLTRSDLSNRLGYLNARNTLMALLELRVIPVINENDVVAVEEIEGATFGDNDSLSALVANLVDADLLVILSDIDGLYTADPNQDPKAELISRVERVDASIQRLAGASVSGRGTGGMITKVEAAKLATAFGVPVVIARGSEPDVLRRVAEGEILGTYFVPTATKMESRRRWLISGLANQGTLAVDEGAAEALTAHNKSLLPAGIREVRGKFPRGATVEVVDGAGKWLACGIANYDSEDISRIKGHRSNEIEEILGYEYGDEVIHRNNLVMA